VITGIVVALPEELTTLTSTKIDKGACLLIGGALLVTYSGAGPNNAKSAAELLVAQGANRLMSWGCAAAVSAGLKPGDLILPGKLIDAENVEMPVDADWHDFTQHTLATFLAVRSGPLAESASLVSTGTDKKQVHSRTGAVALDMETVAIAKVARQHTIPFLAIRVIVDPVDMDLPLAINHSLNNDGEIVMGRLLAYLFLHPAELPGLIKLGLHFNAAKKTLKLVANHLDTIMDFNRPNAPAI
jgi:hopanoid-associated phosphorylase